MVEHEFQAEAVEQEELELEDLEDLGEIELVGEVQKEGPREVRRPEESAPPPEPPEIIEHAMKVYAIELVSGEFVKGSGSRRSYLRLWNGESIEKGRVMGTIVQSFLSNDGTYCALTLDDGTETIRVKGWREDAKAMESFQTGQIVDVIGHIREYDGEVYLSPVATNGISDPNWEPLRELEIYKLRKVKKNDLRL